MLVDEGDDGTKRGRRSRGAVYQAERAVDRDDVVRAVGRDVGVASGRLRVVVLSRGVGRLVVREVGSHGRGLVRWLGEDVAEAAAGVDDGLAGFLGCRDAGTRDDLGRAYGGDIGAAQFVKFSFHILQRERDREFLSMTDVPSARKGWVESARTTGVVCPAGTFGFGAALTAVAGNAVVTG